MLGDPEAVVDGGVRRGGVCPRRSAHLIRRDSGGFFESFGAVLRQADELLPGLEGRSVASLGHELPVDPALGGHHVAHRVHDCHVGTRAQLQMVARLDVRGANKVDRPRIDHDQLGTGSQPALHPRCEDRMRIGGIRSDNHDHIGLLHGLEVLSSRTGAEGLLKSVSGGRVTDPRTGVHVVGLESSSHHLLNDVDLLVRAARGRDATDGVHAVGPLNVLEAICREGNCLIPLDDLPFVVDGLADHRRGHAILMAGVSPGEASLHTGVPGIRATGLVRNHAHELVAAQFSDERTSHSAVGAGGLHLASGHSQVDNGLLLQGGGGACLHARTARDAFALQEGHTITRGDLRAETASGDRQCEGSLDLRAGAHASAAGDALALIEGEIGIGLVLRCIEVVFPLHAVPDITQPHHAGHVLEFAIAVGRAGEAIKGVVGDVQLHDALAQLVQLGSLRANGHPFAARCGARSRSAGLTVDLDQAQTTRSEGGEVVRGTQLRDRSARKRGGAHDRRTFGDLDRHTIDLHRDDRLRIHRRSTEVALIVEPVAHNCHLRPSLLSVRNPRGSCPTR